MDVRSPSSRGERRCRVPRRTNPERLVPLVRDTKVPLAREMFLPPRSRGYVPVQTSFQGNGVISQRHHVYERHRVHVETGTMTAPPTRRGGWK